MRPFAVALSILAGLVAPAASQTSVLDEVESLRRNTRYQEAHALLDPLIRSTTSCLSITAKTTSRNVTKWNRSRIYSTLAVSLKVVKNFTEGAAAH